MRICYTDPVMPLSTSAINELSDERETLIRSKAEIEARLEAINLIVGQARRIVIPRNQLRKGRKAAVVKAVQPVTPAGSLRTAIRAVVSGVDLKPGDVIRRLRASGFQIHGKTPYETRIYNELKRMVREGILVRNAERQYTMKR
jgi:hypothetical protein